KAWWAAWLRPLLGVDADWVLGDLEERHRKRRGWARYLALTGDLASVGGMAEGRPCSVARVGAQTRVLGGSGRDVGPGDGHTGLGLRGGGRRPDAAAAVPGGGAARRRLGHRREWLPRPRLHSGPTGCPRLESRRRR